MPFRDVPATADFVAQERDVLSFWEETQAFDTLRQLRRGHPRWSFIDGPITANNPMGVHHGWGRTYKDLFHRFWVMRGRETRYQNGFDCQGLWVEVEVEKAEGFESKKDIEDYGLARFVLKCKERVLRQAAIQTRQSKRLGYWMDWNDPERLEWLADKLSEDPLEVITVPGPHGPVTDTVEQIVGRLGMAELGGSYFTFSNENNYMIWAFLKRCWERGWLYRGADVMPWCPRCATGISQHEIVTDGYAELTHPSVTLRFPLRGRDRESLLVWTTTPWTLSSNVAAAVGSELIYVKVRQDDEYLYLSKGTLHMLSGDYELVEELSGADMEGWTYDGPFDDLEAAQMPGGYTEIAEAASHSELSPAEAHRVILWDEVGEEEGTGIVHIAPGCGAEDFQLGQAHGLPLMAPLNEEGHFVDHFGWLSGRHVSEVAQPIFEALAAKGLLYHVRDYTHRYPICWRCKTELVFRLVDEWFISMDELRYQMMDITRQIRWIPAFGLERELDWLRNMHDWMISKKRYWGLALPFWVCDTCGHVEVIGDDLELKARATEGYEVFAGHTPHRPYIDAVKIACPQCGGTATRVPDVGNPWLDAGIVSFSTLRYRSDPKYWEYWYPADWISESFPGQFRNWFYSLLAMATVLDNTPPFRENFSYATLLAEDGSPMHKSTGNMIEFNEAADRMGVDVMRWLFCAHKPENNLLFGYGRADEVRRQFLIPLWNVYKFLVTYANLDGWEPVTDGAFVPEQPAGPTPESDNPLDRWILGRLHQVVARCTEALENSDPYGATLAIEAFLDDLTNWYVRRSRPRFWKSEHDADKATAYATLYHVLVTLCQLLAPITPFVSETIYQNLVRAVRSDAHTSIHHCYWPVPDEAVVEEPLLEQMDLARRIASLGRGARSSANLKLRQPLAKALVYVGEGQASLDDTLTEIVADELNVKELAFVSDEAQLVNYRLVADGRALGPKYGALFPKIRAALTELAPGPAVRRLRADLNLILSIDGERIELTPEEVIVETQPREGLAVSADRVVTVAVDAVLTQELEAEGLVRDLVRHIQTLRKDADYQLDDRITVGIFGASGEIGQAVDTFCDYLCHETLCEQLVRADDGRSWDLRRQVKLAGTQIELAVRR
ncbi:MAG: isoleucine--tRNA ligase [Anaerolineae bacterium]|nr:isoleucine--tRNA ligase [Anaerolineae bacterium]